MTCRWSGVSPASSVRTVRAASSSSTSSSGDGAAAGRSAAASSVVVGRRARASSTTVLWATAKSQERNVPGALPVARQRRQRLDEDLARGVRGRLPVAEAAVAVAVDRVGVAGVERGERARVRHRRGHQPGVVVPGVVGRRRGRGGRRRRRSGEQLAPHSVPLRFSRTRPQRQRHRGIRRRAPKRYRGAQTRPVGRPGRSARAVVERHVKRAGGPGGLTARAGHGRDGPVVTPTEDAVGGHGDGHLRRRRLTPGSRRRG
jgi:hypothetical protein